jgi:hypothetical protein
VIGPQTTMMLGEMTLVQLIDLRNAYRYSRGTHAPALLRLLGAEIKIRQRGIRERSNTVVMAHA